MRQAFSGCLALASGRAVRISPPAHLAADERGPRPSAVRPRPENANSVEPWGRTERPRWCGDYSGGSSRARGTAIHHDHHGSPLCGRLLLRGDSSRFSPRRRCGEGGQTASEGGTPDGRAARTRRGRLNFVAIRGEARALSAAMSRGSEDEESTGKRWGRKACLGKDGGPRRTRKAPEGSAAFLS